ncbi:hypothetical protein COLSTE_01651 [Collinsella stercoris DSM 13279]|uniref:Uncharacterized protein n=1 Tax=Collinsella stercoris DSM 13279 TaxID=445975 RepID=B6GC33_9ACTN|nr:hypothetical protein COLSTE_01651 [Collinsella stercoris DSM 13279]
MTNSLRPKDGRLTVWDHYVTQHAKAVIAAMSRMIVLVSSKERIIPAAVFLSVL